MTKNLIKSVVKNGVVVKERTIESDVRYVALRYYSLVISSFKDSRVINMRPYILYFDSRSDYGKIIAVSTDEEIKVILSQTLSDAKAIESLLTKSRSRMTAENSIHVADETLLNLRTYIRLMEKHIDGMERFETLLYQLVSYGSHFARNKNYIHSLHRELEELNLSDIEAVSNFTSNLVSFLKEDSVFLNMAVVNSRLQWLRDELHNTVALIEVAALLQPAKENR